MTQIHDPEEIVAACCAVYSHPLASFLSIDGTMHPGGLALTRRMAESLSLDGGKRVLDAGCGSGASAVFLAEEFGCRVDGITAEFGGVKSARGLARSRGVDRQTSFRKGDLNHAPLKDAHYDAAMAECVVSTLPAPSRVLQSLYSCLRPGGTLAVSDITATADIEPALGGVLGTALCIRPGTSLESMEFELRAAGFRICETVDESPAVADLLRTLELRLLAAGTLVQLGKLELERDVIDRTQELLKAAKRAVVDGQLGYGVVIAERPA